jgi:hypothetical protein
MNTQPHSCGIQVLGCLKVRWFAALWYVIQSGVAISVAEGVAVAAAADIEGNLVAAPHPVRATRAIATDAGAKRRRRIPATRRPMVW